MCSSFISLFYARSPVCPLIVITANVFKCTLPKCSVQVQIINKSFIIQLIHVHMSNKYKHYKELEMIKWEVQEIPDYGVYLADFFRV